MSASLLNLAAPPAPAPSAGASAAAAGAKAAAAKDVAKDPAAGFEALMARLTRPALEPSVNRDTRPPLLRSLLVESATSDVNPI